jgi:hypothetical protein
MKQQQKFINRHEMLRQSALRQIGEVGPFLEGALCAVKRRGCATPGWQLTYKQKGRTRTVYVPMDLVKEVKTWKQAYKHLKRLIRKVTTQSLGLIHTHVANRLADRRRRALTRPALSKASKPSGRERFRS